MIRAVLDANALAAGFVGAPRAASVPGEIMRCWSRGDFVLIVSDYILTELIRTFDKPYFVRHLPLVDRKAALHQIRRYAVSTELTVPVEGIASHPGDDPVLSTALSGHADYLVTGDADLRRLGRIDGVSIVTPREFLTILDQSATSPEPNA